MSELRDEGDISIADDFYRYIGRSGIERLALNEFGDETCNDIIARCRLLRNLDRQKSLKMIGAAYSACNELINNFEPDLFLSLRIDSYVLDIIERIMIRKGKKYIGFWRAAVVPNKIFFTNRGEYIPLTDPDQDQIDDCINRIVSPGFKATSLKNGRKFGLPQFIREYLYYNLRDNFLDLQRRVCNDKYGYRYLTTGKHVDEYKIELKDWKVDRLFDRNWENIFEATPKEKRVFIGLQVNPEATIDYYVPDLEMINYKNVLAKTVKVLGDAGYRIFIKDHPNMFGQRKYRFLTDLKNEKSVVLVPYEVPSVKLVNESKVTFTWTGTIGLQAAMAGNCPVVVNPTYFLPGYFIRVKSMTEVGNLPDLINNFSHKESLDVVRTKLAQHLLRTLVPGVMNWNNYHCGKQKDLNGIKQLSTSLNTYVPQFAGTPPISLCR